MYIKIPIQVNEILDSEFCLFHPFNKYLQKYKINSTYSFIQFDEPMYEFIILLIH